MNPQKIADECAEIDKDLQRSWLYRLLPASWQRQIVASIFCDRHGIKRVKT